MSLQPFAAGAVMGLLATTGAAGFTLQNATPNIISWTAPNDGQLHRWHVLAGKHVTVSETGGAVQVTSTLPDGTVRGAPTVFAGGAGAGTPAGTFTEGFAQGGTTVTVVQSSALSAGASVAWVELWGS